MTNNIQYNTPNDFV